MFLDHLSIRTKALIPVVVMALTVLTILIVTGAQTSSFTAAANDMIGRQDRGLVAILTAAREVNRLKLTVFQSLIYDGTEFRAERQGKENLRRCAHPDQRPPGRGRASPPEPRASDFPVCQAVRRDRRGREISVGYWPERFWGRATAGTPSPRTSTNWPRAPARFTTSTTPRQRWSTICPRSSTT